MASKISIAAACALVSLVIGAAASIGPVTDLYIVNDDVSPAGVERQAVLAGATPYQASFPGPIIKGQKGDNFKINVIDRLTNETMLKTTTIHWHGLFQHGTNYVDGPAFVTQCPIASGNSFLYDFNVPDQAGTFWYHSHLALQYCDGLKGPFIVYDPKDPHKDLYDIDNDDTIISLSDWYNIPAALLPPGPESSAATVINGLAPSQNGSGTLTVFTVKQGVRYRFRLISMACEPNYEFSIDGHNMTIIEADAQNTQPLLVDQLQIFAAQRYSFILNADQPIDNYWIRANDTAANGPLGKAILRYEGAPLVQPTTQPRVASNPLVENNLHPLSDPAAPGLPNIDGADHNLNLNFTFNTTDGLFEVNGTPFIPPTVPVLLQILSGAQQAQDIMPYNSVYSLPSNKTIQISMAGGVVGGGHPLHLHGHTFSVIRSAGNPNYNYANPVRRDTVNIGVLGDNVTIRFRTDNPGPWFLHCHIDFHLNAGFAVVMAEDIPDIPHVNHPTPAWDDLCPIYSALPLSDH